jgi:hypothetical protein
MITAQVLIALMQAQFSYSWVEKNDRGDLNLSLKRISNKTGLIRIRLSVSGDGIGEKAYYFYALQLRPDEIDFRSQIFIEKAKSGG